MGEVLNSGQDKAIAHENLRDNSSDSGKMEIFVKTLSENRYTINNRSLFLDFVS